MKTLYRLFKILALSTGLICMMVVPVKAENNAYVISDVPQDVTDFVINNVGVYIEALSGFVGNDIVVEKGIQLFDYQNTDSMYFFPIKVQNELSYIMRVKEINNEFVAVLSPDVEAFVNLYTSFNSEKILLGVVDYNVMVISDNKAEILYEDPIDSGISYLSENLAIIDYYRNLLNETSGHYLTENVDQTPIMPYSTRANKTLRWNYIEKQGSNSWCNAYATAGILRYFGKDALAPNLAAYYNLSISEAFSSSMVEATAKRYNLTAKYYGSVPNQTIVETEISFNKPVHFYMKLIRSGKTVYHAVVAHGISGSTYTVWNPWYSYSETMNGSTNTYIANNGETMNITAHVKW